MDIEQIILSDEELFFVLSQIGVESLLTMEERPIDGLTTEQEQFVLDVVGKSLRARKLVQLLEGDRWVIQEKLLNVISACIVPEKLVSLMHIRPDQDSSTRYSICKYQQGYVIHSQPTLGMHTFSLATAVNQIVKQILAHCAFTETENTTQLSIALKGDEFAQTQEFVKTQAFRAVNSFLAERGVSQVESTAIIDTLTIDPRMSIFRYWSEKDGALRSQELLFLQGAGHSWFAQTENVGNLESQWHMKTIASHEISSILNDWLA